MTRKVETSEQVGSFARALKRDPLSSNTVGSYETALQQLSILGQ